MNPEEDAYGPLLRVFYNRKKSYEILDNWEVQSILKKYLLT